MPDQQQTTEAALPEPGAPEAVSAPEPAREAAETMPSPQEMLKRAERAAQEHHDAWLRARAEADNIRKRAQADIANAHKYALENFAAELVNVKDSLEAALAVPNAAVERGGVELTLKQLVAAFDKFHIAEISPLGEKFDPHQHQAVSAAESDAAPNTVVQVMQKGYRLHERIVRPALVTVAKAKS